MCFFFVSGGSATRLPVPRLRELTLRMVAGCKVEVTGSCDNDAVLFSELQDTFGESPRVSAGASLFVFPFHPGIFPRILAHKDSGL